MFLAGLVLGTAMAAWGIVLLGNQALSGFHLDGDTRVPVFGWRLPDLVMAALFVAAGSYLVVDSFEKWLLARGVRGLVSFREVAGGLVLVRHRRWRPDLTLMVPANSTLTLSVTAVATDVTSGTRMQRIRFATGDQELVFDYQIYRSALSIGPLDRVAPSHRISVEVDAKASKVKRETPRLPGLL